MNVFLIYFWLCCQHSSLLGPFSEEWKHVSQVKDIMYFLLLSSPLCHTFVITCLFFVLFVCLCVCGTDTSARNRPNYWLQHWKSQELKVKILWRRCYSCWSLARIELTACCLFYLSVSCMQLVLYSVWHVRAEQIQKPMGALLQVLNWSIAHWTPH